MGKEHEDSGENDSLRPDHDIEAGELKAPKSDPNSCAWFFPVLVVTVIMLVYGVFMYAYLVPMMNQLHTSKSDKSEVLNADPKVAPHPAEYVLAIALTWHILVIMLVVSYLRAMLTSPGSIPNEPQWKDPQMFGIHPDVEAKVTKIMSDISTDVEAEAEFIKGVPVLERKKGNAGYRYCNKSCDLYKPDRTHHCKFCKMCVLRMDHHCPYLANCVGYGNYKFFMLALFYAVCCTGFFLGAMAVRFYECFNPILDAGYFFAYDLPVALMYLMCVGLFFLIGIFFSFHVYLTANVMTTIEYKEKLGATSSTLRHQFKVAHKKYDNGYFANLCHVFGPLYLWLIPLAPSHPDRGTYTGFVAKPEMTA